MDLGINGRVALVTGASQGIGRAIAAELVAEGARVAISSRSRERIEATADDIGARPFVHDSTDVDGIAALVAAVVDELGAPIEILVTNTGGPPANPDPLAFMVADWETAHRELVIGPIELIKAVTPSMRERGWGRIVNVASTTVLEPNPALMLSNAERSAILASFKTLARALAADGITLNTVLPGRIATDRIAQLYGSLRAAEESAATSMPARRLGKPEELAAVAAFLCSDRASYVTGEWVRVDGAVTSSV